MGAAERKMKDKVTAGHMKRLGIERTTGRCPVCYRIVEIDGPKSKFKHSVGECIQRATHLSR